MWSSVQISLIGIVVYFGALFLVVARQPSVFFGRFGRNHRLVGLAHLAVLAQGAWDLLLINVWSLPPILQPIEFDILLGVSGIVLTLSAAYDFRKAHASVHNIASGALDETATITVSEMLEHSFYQILNLVQVLFLHFVWRYPSFTSRFGLLILVTSPWLLRNYFPINHFSDNYTKTGTDPSSLIGILYRLKKYQYLLYKHFLLHGLNLTIALSAGRNNLATTPAFRLYWLSLNTAYVMEFFLQTLVKRRRLSQCVMLALNQFLMLVSTSTAVPILMQIDWLPAAASLAMNLMRRSGRDFGNVLLVTLLTLAGKTIIAGRWPDFQ